MGTGRELSALVGRYLGALEKADHFEFNGLTDEAQARRDEAASLLSSIDRDWSTEEIEFAYRQQMDAIFADWQSAHDRSAGSSAGAIPTGIPAALGDQ